MTSLLRYFKFDLKRNRKLLIVFIMILVDFFCKSHYTYISVNVKDTEPDVTGNVFELRFLQKKQFVTVYI